MLDCLLACLVCVLLTYLCPSLPVEHRPSTTPRHRTLFWAALVIPDQLVPCCFSSASVSRLQQFARPASLPLGLCMRSLIYSITFTLYLLVDLVYIIYLFVCFVCSFVGLFVDLFILSFVYVFVCLVGRLIIYLFIDLSIRLTVYLFICHSLIHFIH